MSVINVGLYQSTSPQADHEGFKRLVRQLADDVAPALSEASGLQWLFHIGEPAQLTTDDARRPGDFLDDASLRMTEAELDAIFVVTDVPLVSSASGIVPGLASPLAHVGVMSMRPLRTGKRGQPSFALDGERVRWNAAALLLHLVGRILGMPERSGRSDAMTPFAIADDRRGLPGFADRALLHARAERFPDREHRPPNLLIHIFYYLAALLRHPLRILTPVVRNGAPLMSLRMPSLLTAAVVPTFILIFTAEIWDVGLNMTAPVIWTYAVVSIVAATLYLVFGQNLFLPGKGQARTSDHLIQVNLSILLSMLLAVLGMFAMVMALALVIELFVFPSDLIRTWPTLEDPNVSLVDKVGLAAFISTIGVSTGALAGGLESRRVIRHMSLFLDRP